MFKGDRDEYDDHICYISIQKYADIRHFLIHISYFVYVTAIMIRIQNHLRCKGFITPFS